MPGIRNARFSTAGAGEGAVPRAAPEALVAPERATRFRELQALSFCQLCRRGKMARGPSLRSTVLRIPVLIGSGLLMWTLWSMVPRAPAPASRKLLAVPKPAAADTLSMLAPVHPHMDPVEEQERYCQGLSTQQEPPAVLDIPWVAADTGSGHHGGKDGSAGSARIKLLPAVRSRFLASGTLAVSEPYSMYVFGDSDIVSGHIAAQGSWEPGMTAEMVTKLSQVAQAKGVDREKVVFLDIGANVGAHTMAVAAHGFQVLAFEPMSINIQCLRRTLCANPGLRSRITLIPKGLGNATQECTIYSPTDNQGDGVVACGADDSPTRYMGMVPRGKLDIVKLDNYMRQGTLENYTGRIGVVKMDVEGNELSVLDGGLRFFETVRPPYVTAECSDPMMMRANGKPASAFFKKMSELGYSVHRHSFDGPIIPPELFESWREPSIANYWFKLS